MTLMEQITNDLKEAMKTSNKFDLSVYRMLKSALQLESIKEKHDLSDEEVIAVIKKQVKVRKESMKEYTEYNRNDLVENLEKEIAVLAKYLPEELSEEEIQKEIDKVFQELNPESIKDMGKVMKSLTEKIGSVADMSQVSAFVKSRLS